MATNEHDEMELDGGLPIENSPSIQSGISGKDIITEMEESYLDYAMSVIVARALPDVRDGLKPVQRRILYTMKNMGITAGSKYKKSARIIGEVMGKYHPHGDSSIYAAMVRLAQPFALRQTLVDGQGNYGSMDGDPAAASRYTEARMTKLAEELLEDLEKETVPFRPNYDGSEEEPSVLPGKFPNLLVNGNLGIAVGMATNLPPNNISEVLTAIQLLVKHPESDMDAIMDIIQGPDFPTGGIIYDRDHIKRTYATGRGSIIMRARTDMEETKSGRTRIVISEVPYQVNKATMVEKIADLVRDKKIVGITDIRDESNKKGVRVVIDLKKDAHAKKILNQLFKYSQMQTTFPVNMIALVDGLQPHVLNIKSIIEYYIEHRKIVIRKRTEFDLKKAQDRIHILHGLKIALDNIDEVIKTIRAAATQEDAKVSLIAKFSLSERQAEAILSMQLRRLAALEREKIENEIAELERLIAKYEEILANPQLILDIIHDEAGEMLEKYGEPRRTEVVPYPLGKFQITDTIPNDEMLITITKENYIKRMPSATFKSQKRGGKGIIGLTTKEEDEIQQMLATRNHNQLLFFTSEGRVFKLHVYEIEQASRQAKGQAVVNLLNLRPREKVVAMLDITENVDAKYLFMSTKKGVVKKTELALFQNILSKGIIAIKIREDDELLWVRATSGGNDVMIITENGQSVRFSEDNVRPMGRASSGVRGIKLKGEDSVISMNVVADMKSRIFVLTERGLGKMSNLDQYRLQTRGGSGIKAVMVTAKTGKVIGSRVIAPGEVGDILMISRNGQMLRIDLADVPLRGRVTQGVYIMRFKSKEDVLASFSVVPKEE
ncbi:DNA gyrase subunit A [Candidatus Gracilibacteria bacterium CG17_big_fil_post_rev_8_21_14_2_50_48_13]|nr:MAG: DNA gyrase subunit A [Candidatus Gracilibacteria bacterium CG17_big_fil_post_rev_8_21_14_2_50_48_13]